MAPAATAGRAISETRRAASPTGLASGPRPDSQPAQSSTGTATAGKNQVQSIADWMPNADTTQAERDQAFALGRLPGSSADHRVLAATDRAAEIVHDTSSARLMARPSRPRSANVCTR